MWDLSCPDWEDRIRAGRSLIPALPLIRSEADMGLAFFDELKLPDVPGKPRLGDAAGQWFRDIVATSFGSWDPQAQQNFIRDIFVLAPKGSSKTSYGAGFALAVMLMNKRPRAEALFIGPTQAISDRAYEQAVGMIDESPDLKRRFRPRDHIKTIEDLVNHSEMKVKTFDLNILTGSILIFAHLDEIHLLGRTPYAGKVIRQIRGGIDKTPEGKFLITTTESDDIPAGAFKDELHNARKHRDGAFRDKNARPTLSVMYEFPTGIAEAPVKWRDPANWPMVQPNLGRSVHMQDLLQSWNSDKEKGEQSIREWASQYLNIEMGVGHKVDGWGGAEFWAHQADETLTLEELIRRSEVATVGIDGGGLDDLLGLCVIGREKVTRRWLIWCHAYANRIVLERRKDIAARLLDFEQEGSLTFCNVPDDVAALAGVVAKVMEAGLLPEKNAVGFDPNNVGVIIEALVARKVTDDMLRRLRQGPALSPALWGLERKLSDSTVLHSGSPLMDWAVGNVKVQRKDNGDQATKQLAGSAKIDPFIAMLCAAILMSWNPAPAATPAYQLLIA